MRLWRKKGTGAAGWGSGCPSAWIAGCKGPWESRTPPAIRKNGFVNLESVREPGKESRAPHSAFRYCIDTSVFSISGLRYSGFGIAGHFGLIFDLVISFLCGIKKLRADKTFDLARDGRVILQELRRVGLALTDLVAAIGIPGA